MVAKTLSKSESEPDIENAGPDYEGFKRYLRGKHLSRRTRDAYAKHLRQVVRLGGGHDPAAWTPEDCQVVKEGARDDEDAPMQWLDYQITTQQQFLSSLKQYWSFTKRYDLISGVENIDFWNLGRKRQVSYDDILALTMPGSDVETLREYCEDTILHSRSPHKVNAAFQAWLLLSYGIRAVGLTHFHVVDLDVADRSVRIRRTKNNSSRKIVMDIDPTPFLPRFTWARRRILKGIAKRVPDLAERCKRMIEDPDTLMFFIKAGKNGARILDPLEDGIKSAFRRTTKEALGEAWGTHSVRHAKIFQLLEVENWRPHIVQVYAGHKDVSQTLRYCPIGLEEQRKELERNGNGPDDQEMLPPDRLELKAAYKVMFKAGKMTAEEYIATLESEALL